MLKILLLILLVFTSTSAFADTIDGWSSTQGTLWDVEASSDGKWTAVAAAAGFVQVFNQSDLAPIKRIDLGKSPVFTVAFSPDSQYLATCNIKGQVQVFSTFDWQVTHRFKPGKSCGLLAFGKDQLAVVGASDTAEKYRNLWLYTLSSQKLSSAIMKDNTNIKYISALAFAPDGKTFAVGSSNAKQEVDLFLSDQEQVKKLRRIKVHGDISALDFSPDGAFIAGGGTVGQLNLWQVSTGKRFWQVPWRKGKKFISSVAFAPKGDLIAVCGMGRGAPVTFYRKGNGKQVSELGKVRGMNCNQVRFDASGQHLYVVRQVFSNFNEQVLTRYSL